VLGSKRMAELKLTDDEVQAIRAVLGAVTIRRRTGELGITHGLERFVSTRVVVERRLLQNRKLDRGEPRALRGTAREGKASSA
jgi:hypothetical protein